MTSVPAGYPKLSFFGAAGTVTGSRYLVEHGDRQVLVDCGLFQGPKELRRRNWSALPFDPQAIDAVVLTHAHIDHSGFLPALVRAGFRGPIYCSDGTFELCRILLPDSAHLQEEDAKYANRHGTSKHTPALPLYTVEDAKKCLLQFKAMPCDIPFTAAADCRVTLKPAGHLLGACFVKLQMFDPSLTFSGDLGRHNDPILHAPAVPDATDYLICESTYGDREHPDLDGQFELGQWLNPVCERQGVVVIPAFAVGRAQTLLLYIARLKHQRRLPDVPVFLDSPMAIDASGLYHRFRDDHRLNDEECQQMCQAATLVRTPDESKRLDRQSGPMIIISASGMATGGRVVHHLKAFVGQERNLVLLAGFQAPGTRGDALARGIRTLRIHGQEYPVRAEVGLLRASSGHADAGELLGWMRQLNRPPRHVFVTHGESSASEALRSRIEHDLGWKASVPSFGDSVELPA